MKLYGSLASPYVARVVLAARCKGLELPLEMPPGGLKSPEYLAINPFGKMPSLEHDGRVVIESEVICEYLEELHPAHPMLPADPYERARVRTLARLTDLYLAPESMALFRQINPATRDAAAVEAGQAKLAKSFAHFAALCGDGPFAWGSGVTLADCALLPNVLLMQKTIVPALGVDDPTRRGGQLARWWEAIEADPLASAFAAEYGAAVDAFLARMRGG